MGKCLDDLRANYGRGLTDDEKVEIFKDAEKLYAQVQASTNASNMQAQAQILAARQAAREKIAAVIQKRNTYLQIQRKGEILEYSLGNWQGREGEGLSALMVGGKRIREGSRMSVDSLRQGIKGEYLGGLLTDIEALSTAHLKQFQSGALDREIVRAMHTIDNPNVPAYTGPQMAMEIAQVAHKWQEKARLDQNRVGGFINKMPGYIVRQSHDAAKIREAGYQTWKSDIEGWLDWSKIEDGIFDPAINPSTTPKARDDFLGEVYKNVSTGMHLKLEGKTNPLASNSRVGSLAKRVSQERILHFLDGDAWFDYNEKYGTGKFRDALSSALSRAADNTALMQIFGPSPQANLENVVKFIQNSLKDRQDQLAINRFDSIQKRLKNEMMELDGSVNIPAGTGMLAGVGRWVRALQSMSKLGGAVISSLSDAPNFAYEMAYQGKPFFQSLVRGFGHMVKGRGTLEQRRILSSCGVFFDAMNGNILERFSGGDMPGKMSAMMNLFFKMNGLSWWTDAWKKAATLMMAHDMALMRGQDFASLNAAQQRLFKLYGIDEAQWDMLRKGRTMAADGREYLTPEAAFDVSDAEISAYLVNKGMKDTSMRVENFRNELADRLRTLYRDRVQYAVLEPDARTNAILRLGRQAGTVEGEALRYVMQFKSFPAVFLQRTVGRELFGRGADGWGEALAGIGKGALASAFMKNRHGEFSNFAGLFVMMTIFGYGSMTAKQLIAGKTPRELLSDDGAFGVNWKTVLAAMAQGGGMGIYGDFLFGEKSRMGSSFYSALAGPTGGTLESIYNLYQDAKAGKDIGSNSFRFFFQLNAGQQPLLCSRGPGLFHPEQFLRIHESGLFEANAAARGKGHKPDVLQGARIWNVKRAARPLDIIILFYPDFRVRYTPYKKSRAINMPVIIHKVVPLISAISRSDKGRQLCTQIP